MIYHIFPASTHHLTPNLINRLSKCNQDEKLFAVIGKSSFDYVSFGRKNNLNLEVFDCEKSFLESNTPLKHDLIFLHGDSYKRMFFFLVRLYKNIHWVCWGSGTKVNKSIKSIVSYFVKLVLYRLLKGCICLSMKDKHELERAFFINNVVFQNYPTDFDFNPVKIIESISDVKKIYFGNNPCCLSANLKLLPKLSHQKDCEILFMLSYSLEGYSNELGKLKQLSNTNFNNSIILYTDFLSLKDYYSFMNNCSVYICNEESQSGLGAIFTCIKLGKKLYLNGNNYDFITSLGIHVNHVDELCDYSQDLHTPYSLNIKQKNLDILNQYFSPDTLLQAWHNYYECYC